MAAAYLHAPAAPAKDTLSQIPQAHLTDGLSVSQARALGLKELRRS